MLTVHEIVKRYGDDLVLDRVSFTINPGERVGLVGPNGCGKSTLLRIIAGVEQPDSGSITRTPPDLTIGYLPQGWDWPPDMSIDQALRDAQRGVSAAQAALAEIEQRMAAPGLGGTELATLLDSYDAAQARFEALGGYEWEHRAAAVLAGLELDDLPPATPVAVLSGGQKTRLGLARLLLAGPDLLLLDEPTNHLDVDALEWLEGFLNGYAGAVLIVSHDRTFLDQTVARILELSLIDRFHNAAQLRAYTGGYSEYAATKEHERLLHEEQWQDQQAYIARVESDIRRLKNQALGVELTTTPAQPTVRRVAKKVAKKAKSRERKLERYMESDERVTKPHQDWKLKLDFSSSVDGPRIVLRVDQLGFDYSSSGTGGWRNEPGSADSQSPIANRQSPAAWLLHDISFELSYGERVALVGPNGAGKTTLLRLISGRLEPCAGRVALGSGVQVGYLSQEQETLDSRRTILESLRAVAPWGETEARSFLHRYLFAADEVFRPVAACSFGERARLALALLVAQGCTFLVLDEPINHLDIPARERFEAALTAFPGTILAVAHDRYFLEQFARRVLSLRGGTVVDYPGGYADFMRADRPGPCQRP